MDTIKYKYFKYKNVVVNKIGKYLRKDTDSWIINESYIKNKGQWLYLYTAVDTNGALLDFYMSNKRNKREAKDFFDKRIKNGFRLNAIKNNNEENFEIF